MRSPLISIALSLIVSSVALGPNTGGKKSREQKIAEERIRFDKELTEASKHTDIAAASVYTPKKQKSAGAERLRLFCKPPTDMQPKFVTTKEAL